MTEWTAAELTVFGPAPELFLSARQPDGTLSPPATVWVVRVQDALYVRSVYGANDPFFLRAIGTGRASVLAGKAEHEVALEQLAMTPAEFAVIDAGFRAKYAVSPPAIMGAIAGGLSAQATLRILPA
jgi:hypothetical protein